jgi:hypothetical protein
LIITPNRVVLTMAAIRVLSACLEFGAALLFLKSNRVETALRINSLLGLVGPAIFLLVSLLGVTALAGRVEPAKMTVIIAGIALVLYGTTR